MRWMGILLLIGFFHVQAQDLKPGILVDQLSREPIEWAHIQNLTQRKFTVTDQHGKFQLPVALGDSIWISCVGFKDYGVIVQEQYAQSMYLVLTMARDTILLRELTINVLPEESIFKQRILNYQPEESPEYFGIPRIEMGYSSLLEESTLNHPLFIATHPFSFLYHKTSKKEKEKRKMHQINKNQRQTWNVARKYNRDLVHQLTRLDGDELTSFMSYCNFSDAFLAGKTEYQIAELIIEKLDEFHREGKG